MYSVALPDVLQNLFQVVIKHGYERNTYSDGCLFIILAVWVYCKQSECLAHCGEQDAVET
jgi:hypothetical protein